MKAMLLTAGLGTRLRPVTDHLPKPAVPFLNVPLMYYPLTLLEDSGLSRVVFNTHRFPEKIESLARAMRSANFEKIFSTEAAKPLGSAGGLRQARQWLEGDGCFILANGDEVILPQQRDAITRLLEDHHSQSALATILVMEHPLVGTQFGGVWTRGDGSVAGFGKDQSPFGAGLSGYHYVGVIALNDRVFQYIDEADDNILYQSLMRAANAGERVQVSVGHFTWFETGNPRDFVAASIEALELLTQRDRVDAAFLQNLLNQHWTPGTQLDLRSDRMLVQGANARIAASAQLKGAIVLGDGAEVGERSQIENVVLLPGAKIASAQIVHSSLIT